MSAILRFFQRSCIHDEDKRSALRLFRTWKFSCCRMAKGGTHPGWANPGSNHLMILSLILLNFVIQSTQSHQLNIQHHHDHHHCNHRHPRPHEVREKSLNFAQNPNYSFATKALRQDQLWPDFLHITFWKFSRFLKLYVERIALHLWWEFLCHLKWLMPWSSIYVALHCWNSNNFPPVFL